MKILRIEFFHFEFNFMSALGMCIVTSCYVTYNDGVCTVHIMK